MDGIIGLIIIISVIMKLIEGDKNKENDKKKQSKKQSGEQWQQMIFDFVDKAGEYAGQKKERQSYSSSSTNRRYSDTGRSGSRNAGNDTYYYAQQQKATKDRLRQKYGSQPVNSYAKKAETTDILSRAKENVEEEAQNTFKQEVHAEVCAEYRSHAQTAPDLAEHAGHSPECDALGESDIIKRVNDLIVMGYDGQMEFDRDFVAEGVEMLNSFSL